MWQATILGMRLLKHLWILEADKCSLRESHFPTVPWCTHWSLSMNCALQRSRYLPCRYLRLPSNNSETHNSKAEWQPSLQTRNPSPVSVHADASFPPVRARVRRGPLSSLSPHLPPTLPSEQAQTRTTPYTPLPRGPPTGLPRPRLTPYGLTPAHRQSAPSKCWGIKGQHKSIFLSNKMTTASVSRPWQWLHNCVC